MQEDLFLQLLTLNLIITLAVTLTLYRKDAVQKYCSEKVALPAKRTLHAKQASPCLFILRIFIFYNESRLNSYFDHLAFITYFK